MEDGATHRRVTSRILQVCAALNASEVQYLVIGGAACVLHGYVRATTDVDILIEPTRTASRFTISPERAVSSRRRAHARFLHIAHTAWNPSPASESHHCSPLPWRQNKKNRAFFFFFSLFHEPAAK